MSYECTEWVTIGCIDVQMFSYSCESINLCTPKSVNMPFSFIWLKAPTNLHSYGASYKKIGLLCSCHCCHELECYVISSCRKIDVLSSRSRSHWGWIIICSDSVFVVHIPTVKLNFIGHTWGGILQCKVDQFVLFLCCQISSLEFKWDEQLLTLTFTNQ